MSFLRLVASDVKNGIARYWYRHLAVFCFFILSATVLWAQEESYYFDTETWVLDFATHTFGDYFANAFVGMAEYIFDPENPFNFPALWTFTFLLVAYLSLNYPYQDLRGMGKHLLVESGSRSQWWFSKCFWVALNVALFYASFALAVFCLVYLSGGGLDIGVSADVPHILSFGHHILPRPWDILGMLLLFPAMTLALCLLQLFLSLVLRPIFGFLCTVSLLFFSAYFMNPFLPGNYLMVARSNVFVENGMGFGEGMLLAAGIILVSALCGRAYFCKMDILERV